MPKERVNELISSGAVQGEEEVSQLVAVHPAFRILATARYLLHGLAAVAAVVVVLMLVLPVVAVAGWEVRSYPSSITIMSLHLPCRIIPR